MGRLTVPRSVEFYPASPQDTKTAKKSRDHTDRTTQDKRIERASSGTGNPGALNTAATSGYYTKQYTAVSNTNANILARGTFEIPYPAVVLGAEGTRKSGSDKIHPDGADRPRAVARALLLDLRHAFPVRVTPPRWCPCPVARKASDRATYTWSGRPQECPRSQRPTLFRLGPGCRIDHRQSVSQRAGKDEWIRSTWGAGSKAKTAAVESAGAAERQEGAQQGRPP